MSNLRSTGSKQGSQDDEFLNAVLLIQNYKQIDRTLLMRELKIGFNRAGRLIKALHEARHVAEPDNKDWGGFVKVVS